MMFRLVWIDNKVTSKDNEVTRRGNEANKILEFVDFDTCVSFAVTNLSIFGLLWIIYDVDNNLVYLGDTYDYDR